MAQTYRTTTEEMTAPNGETLCRIEATQDIPSQNVKAGDLGGWLGKEAELRDEAWIADEAMVYGFAIVYDSARVENSAQVSGFNVFGGSERVGGRVVMS